MQESLGVICERSCIEGFWGTVPPSLMMSLLFKAQLKPRDSSVEVRSDWEVKEEMDFPRLMKMRYMEVADPLDMWVKHTCCVSSVVNQGKQKVTSICPVSCSECCGALEYYDKAFDRITTRNEKQLKSIKRIFHTVTTTDDPVIRKVMHTTSETHQERSEVCLSLSVY